MHIVIPLSELLAEGPSVVEQVYIFFFNMLHFDYASRISSRPRTIQYRFDDFVSNLFVPIT